MSWWMENRYWPLAGRCKATLKDGKHRKRCHGPDKHNGPHEHWITEKRGVAWNNNLDGVSFPLRRTSHRTDVVIVRNGRPTTK